RYFEVRRNGQGWTHHQVALEASDYLEATLAEASRGATPASLEAVLLAHDPEASREEASEYIASLIDHQVLVSELRPTVTGPEPIAGLVARLKGQPRIAETGDGSKPHPSMADRLEQAEQQLAELDRSGLGVDPARYREIAQSLAVLPCEIQL